MDLENTQNNSLAKLPLLKQGEYDTWRLRIESYIQLQDYALWEIIEEGNSFKPVARTTTNEDGTSTTTIPGAVTAEQKILKKNDLKARSILMMTLPSEHLLTFNKHKDAKSLFEAIEARFGGNEATKKTQKGHLKSRCMKPSVLLAQSHLTLSLTGFIKLYSVQMVFNTANVHDSIGSYSVDDCYGVNSGTPAGSENKMLLLGAGETKRNLGWLGRDGEEVRWLEEGGAWCGRSDRSGEGEHFWSSPKNSPENFSGGGGYAAIVFMRRTNNSTASLSDATVYAYLATQPNGSQVVHEDLEQIHEDDLDEMDLKWQLALLSMKAESFIRELLRHFARCKNPRSQENMNRSQDSSRRTVNVEESSSKAMLAIDGTGFDWSYMADQEASTNFALMAFSDSEVQNNKTCSKTCLKIFEDLKYRYDKLRIKLNKSETDLDSYKKGLTLVEEQLVFYKKNEGMLCDQIAVLKRDASFDESDIDALKKQFRYINRKSSLFAPPSIDLSNSGLEKFKQPEFEGYGVKVNKGASENVSKEVKKTSDAPIIEDWVSDCDEDETVMLESLNVQKPKQADQPRKDQTVLALAIPGQTTTGKESSNPFMAGSLPKTINSNNVDEESQKMRHAQVMDFQLQMSILFSEVPVYTGEDLKILMSSKISSSRWKFKLSWRYSSIVKKTCLYMIEVLSSALVQIGVHSLFLDGTSIQINMLVEKKYPLKKTILEKMINLKIEAEEDSNMAIELIKFIKSQIA
ncbi:hypothetical protein Tco_1531124 [Tanacetum coccineum]